MTMQVGSGGEHGKYGGGILTRELNINPAGTRSFTEPQ